MQSEDNKKIGWHMFEPEDIDRLYLAVYLDNLRFHINNVFRIPKHLLKDKK